MLTALPCGGFGMLDPQAKTAEIRCSTHRIWERDAEGHLVVDLFPDPKTERMERLFVFRDTKGCGAITQLDAHGKRVIVGYAEEVA